MKHNACSHPRTPAGRAACRRSSPQIDAKVRTPVVRTLRRQTAVEAPGVLSDVMTMAADRGWTITRVGYVDGEGVINVLSPAGTLIYAWRVEDPDDARVWFRPIRTSVAQGQPSLGRGVALLLKDKP
jgi:hypothetical protein